MLALQPRSRRLAFPLLVRAMATGPSSNQYPPPQVGRGATADLCDVHCPDLVDAVVAAPKVQIAAPVFR